jgi:predicted ester cyclase
MLFSRRPRPSGVLNAACMKQLPSILFLRLCFQAKRRRASRASGSGSLAEARRRSGRDVRSGVPIRCQQFGRVDLTASLGHGSRTDAAPAARSFLNDRAGASIAGHAADADLMSPDRPGGYMTIDEIAEFYRGYIACLNAQDWRGLHLYVADRVVRNGTRVGLEGYREMLESDFRAVPDLSFNIGHLVCQPPMIASRLCFDCTPIGTLFGMRVDGKRVRFEENVFYETGRGRIQNVWSVIDKAAVAAQL